MSAEEEDIRPNPAWKIALVGAPVFLLLSSAFAMWIWWKRSLESDLDPRLALQAEQVSAGELDDHLRKLGTLIGERDWETEEGRANMRRTIAFVEGTLSPQNYGFEVENGLYVTHEGERWPTVWADLKGTTSPGEVVLVTASYDLEIEDVAVVLSATNDLRDESFAKTVRFAFYPSVLLEAGEGVDLTDLIREGESESRTLILDIPGEAGIAPNSGLSGTELVPVAQGLVEKVRESAR